jgi:hypothetical protein
VFAGHQIPVPVAQPGQSFGFKQLALAFLEGKFDGLVIITEMKCSGSSVSSRIRETVSRTQGMLLSLRK